MTWASQEPETRMWRQSKRAICLHGRDMGKDVPSPQLTMLRGEDLGSNANSKPTAAPDGAKLLSSITDGLDSSVLLAPETCPESQRGSLQVLTRCRL